MGQVSQAQLERGQWIRRLAGDTTYAFMLALKT
jgi:hypothetical protein